ncbi:MAG: NFACT family protein, partial [Schwartzia sp.]|nr:NFACT family protein [Schwartzia sp. (in: firmicutes)]
MSLDGFSLRRLVRELDATLAGSRVDRISQPNKQTIQIALRQPGENHLLTVSIHPRFPVLYRPPAPLENPPEPPSFCMLLRKQLEAGRVAAIRQLGLDRVVIIDIDCLAAGGRIITKSLVAELMGKYSNLILVQDGTIIDALRRVGANSSRVRLVLPGGPYEPPPDRGQRNVLETPPDEITAALKEQGGKSLTSALSAVCQGFGPVTAREVAFGAGLAADLPVASLDDADLASVGTSLQETVTVLQDPAARPCLVRDGSGKLLAMAAFPLHYLTEGEIEDFL